MREVFNGLRYLVQTGVHGRMLPHDLPPWPVVYQQLRSWMAAECFEALVHDLRVLLRRAAERQAQPLAAILDSRTVQSTPESGGRAGYNGHKRRKGSKVHAAVDTVCLFATLGALRLKQMFDGLPIVVDSADTGARKAPHEAKHQLIRCKRACFSRWRLVIASVTLGHIV